MKWTHPLCFSFQASQWKPLTVYLGLVLLGFTRGSREPSKLHCACSTINAVMWTFFCVAGQEPLIWGLKG